MSYILSTTSHIKLAQDLSKESNIPLLQTKIVNLIKFLI